MKHRLFQLFCAMSLLLSLASAVAWWLSRDTVYMLSRGRSDTRQAVELVGGFVAVSVARDPNGVFPPDQKTERWRVHSRALPGELRGTGLQGVVGFRYLAAHPS